jgi:TonB-dependent SusC/RagA subfamily outer membrane receptor
MKFNKIIKMRIKILFLVLLSLLCTNSLNAQKNSKKITITGTVMDVSKSPIANAIVMIDGQKTSSVTDSKGYYKVKVRPNASKIGILTFGSGIIEEAIGGRALINFNFSTMSTQVSGLNNDSPGEEVVNVGYNHAKKKNLTTDVSRVDGTNNKYYKYSNIYDMISREVAGVRISGENIIIQESKDLFGSVPALLVVDGVAVPSINNITPSMVESITVLKGTSAAIYGSRGYGGAIVIKTKIKND